MRNRQAIFKFLSCSNFLSAAFLLIASLAIQGCGTTEPEQTPVVTVQTTPARRGPIALTVSAEAVVSPLQQAIITPKITSTIKKFYVQRGSHVKEGQLLATLENADLEGAEEQSKGEFEQAEAGYATTTGASLPQQIQKAELDAAAYKSAYEAQKKIYDARKDLFDQGAIPRRDLDSAEVGLIQARSADEQAQRQLSDLQRLGKEQALKSAAGQLSAAKGKYLNAKAQLSYSEIRSPIDGVVTDRPLFQGELAAANQPIMTVMNTSKVIAKAHIVQNEAVLLRAGDPAELKLEGLDEQIAGRVTLISPALDPGSTTIEVWIEADKPNPGLKPGVNVLVEITAKSVKDALIVPAASVFKSSEGGDYVLVAGSDLKAHQAKVRVGIRNKELAEIQSGIKTGDQVITKGGYAVPDNTTIVIEAAPAADSDSVGDKTPAEDRPDAKTDDKSTTVPKKGKE
ncbi:MAG: efflux RND transporter periplasmic adaptor subunit [Candidatus Acidiferrum sp.]